MLARPLKPLVSQLSSTVIRSKSWPNVKVISARYQVDTRRAGNAISPPTIDETMTAAPAAVQNDQCKLTIVSAAV